jgi:hypothetical protein
MQYTSAKKTDARSETIIKQYRQHFGYTIPRNQQYWSICGLCVTDDGSLISMSEPSQLIQSNLIVPEQFHGVDRSGYVFQKNKQYRQSRWYNEDFLVAMYEANNEDNFHPAVVNVDTKLMPEKGTALLARIMAFLSDLDLEHGVLVVGNFILRNRHMEVPASDIGSRLSERPQFETAVRSKEWSWDDQCFVYYGTRSNRTKMGSKIFILNGVAK